jgi:hypothetical protein
MARSRAKPIIEYILRRILEDKEEAKKLAWQAEKYTIVGDELYRRDFSQPLLNCITDEQADYVIQEIHSGVRSIHIGGRSLATKVLRAGQYWPTLRDDCTQFFKMCEKCQRFGSHHQAPAEALFGITSPWRSTCWEMISSNLFP